MDSKTELTPAERWDIWSFEHKVCIVAALRYDWPKMSKSDRQRFAELHPKEVMAAGLWPGVAGDQALIDAITDEHIRRNKAEEAGENPDAHLRSKEPFKWSQVLKLPAVPWHEHTLEVQTLLIKSLQKDWNRLPYILRALKMANNPDMVKAAGLWPENEKTAEEMIAYIRSLP